MPQDLVAAYMWFDLAARSEAADVPRFLTTWVEFVASGDHEARNMRDHLAEQMTRKQRSSRRPSAPRVPPGPDELKTLCGGYLTTETAPNAILFGDQLPMWR